MLPLNTGGCLIGDHMSRYAWFWTYLQWKTKVTFKYRWSLNRGDHMGRFGCILLFNFLVLKHQGNLFETTEVFNFAGSSRRIEKTTTCTWTRSKEEVRGLCSYVINIFYISVNLTTFSCQLRKNIAQFFQFEDCRGWASHFKICAILMMSTFNERGQF